MKGDNGMPSQEKSIVEYRVYSLPTDMPVCVLTGEEWRISDQPNPRLHFHNCMEIGFCHSESGTLRFEEQTVPFQAGDVFFILRHVPHTTYSTAGCRSLWSYLFIDLNGIVHSMPDSSQAALGSSQIEWATGCLKVTADTSNRLHFLANCLLEEAKQDTQKARTLLRIYALALNAELARYNESIPQRVSRPSKIFPLKPALEYITDHYMEPCDTKTLADLCHLSQTHFRRMFLKCIEQTPLHFVISTRIYQACQLLANTSDPVLSIAQAVGMPSASSFNRNFQQIVGMSPKQYRMQAELTGQPGRRSDQQVVTYKGWTVPDK